MIPEKQKDEGAARSSVWMRSKKRIQNAAVNMLVIDAFFHSACSGFWENAIPGPLNSMSNQ